MNKYVIALYIRLSVEDSKTESLSIVNQRAALRKYAETLDAFNNAEIIEFADNGYSGLNFERPAVQELLELVNRGKVDCIIVKDFSRFGRNSIETGYFIEKVFPLFKIRFISINDNFDTNDFIGETGGLEVAFKYLINEMYSYDLSVKSKSAKRAKMNRGEYQSNICPYGYKKGINRLEIDEETAPFVKIIFELAAVGKNTQEIAQTLCNMKVPTPGEYKVSKGSKVYDVSRCRGTWVNSTVLRILDDERYIGTYIASKRESKAIGGSRLRLKDENEWVKIPNHHPAIVDAELYESAQSKIRHFKSVKVNFNEYPLRGKVFCGCCLHALQRCRNTPSFRCRFSKSAECYGSGIKESELEELLFKIISKQSEVILGIDCSSDVRELKQKLKEQSEYETRIRDCINEKMRLYEKHFNGEINDSEYHKEKSTVDVKLSELQNSHGTVSATATRLCAVKERNSVLQDIAKNISDEKVLNRALVEALIEKVLIFPDNRIEIFWKMKDFMKNF